MDTNTLVPEVAQLSRNAATARSNGNEEEARAHLVTLLNLLIVELAGEAPAEPETPPAPEQTPET